MAQTLISTMSTRSIVRPSSPTPPQHMYLPAVDFVWRWFPPNGEVLFFKLDENRPLSSFDSVVAHLKSSLASALVHFFPLAGRAFEQEINGRLALDCNDAGVPFIEAYADMPFSSLENDGFKYRPFFKDFVPQGDVTRWTGPDFPLLSVQVTRFARDEGFALGVGHSHIVADGIAFWHFMKSWGECARGVPLSLQPVHDMREELAPEKLKIPPGENAQPPLIFPEGELMDLEQREFHFTSEMVRKLKHMAITSAPAGHAAPFSSLQALSAHIWKHVIAATDMDESTKSFIRVVADIRSRLQPPLPEGYFGNAITGGLDETIASKEELQQESLGATALRVQELVKRISDEESVRSFFATLEGRKPFESVGDGMFKLLLSGSPRFPVYSVDFGWGPPLCVRIPRIHNKGEMMWLSGREGGGSIDVSLALPKPAMEKLEQVESFLLLGPARP